MPSISANATTFRAGNYTYTGYLSSAKQTVVFARAVNQGTIGYPVQELTYDDPDGGVGAFSDVREGMTIRFFDGNSTRLKGVARVAVGGADATTIQINESSLGNLRVANNDRFDVVDEYRIWDTLVSNDGNFNKDSREAYTDQTDNYAPVAIGGGPWVGFVDTGETFATVTFDGTDSYTVDPDSVGTVTYSWDVGDGTITVGTSNSSSITATFPAGERHVLLTVTDSSNSETSTIPIYVRVHDSSDAPLPVIVESLTGNAAAGWSCEFRIPDTTASDIATLPDGAPIYYFERENYNGTIESFGSNAPTDDRSHMKFVGYLDSETLEYDAETNEVRFIAVSPLRILEKTGALPQILVRESSPSTWQEAKALTVAVMFWYLWRYGASLAHDVLYLDAREFAQTRLTVQDDSSIAGQLRDIANSLNMTIECDRLGRIYAVRDADYLSDSDRNARTTTYNFTTYDIINISIPRQHYRAVKAVRGEGVSAAEAASGVFGLFSDGPGPAPASGAQRETLARQVCLESNSQTDLNNRTGYHFAKVNSLYRNSDDATYIVPRGVQMTLPDGYDVFDPAYREYVTITLSDGARGQEFTTDDRWTIQSVNIVYDLDLGTKDITLTLDHETKTSSGTTVTRVTQEELGIPPFTPTSLDLQPFEPVVFAPSDQLFVTRYNGTMAIFAETSVVYVTRNFRDTSPTWTPTNISGLVGNVSSFALDGTALDAGWIATASGVYYVSDIFGTPTATLQFSYGVGGGRPNIRANIADTQTVTVALNYNNAPTRKGVWTSTSTDGGSTWSTIQQVTSGANTSGGGLLPGLEISPKNAAIQYLTGATNVSGLPNIDLYRSTDTGATWSSLGSIGSDEAPMIHSLYDADGEVYWYAVADNLTPGQAVYRSDTGSTNYVSGLTDGTNTYVPFTNNSFYAAPNNRSRIAMAAAAATSSFIANRRMFVSEDEGLTWVESPNPDAVRFNRCYTDGETVYAFTTRGRVFVESFNNMLAGRQMTEKTGDFSVQVGFGDLQGIIGGGD